MDSPNSVAEMCAPAKIFIGGALVTTLFVVFFRPSIMSMVIHGVTVAVWTVFLEFLCQNKMEGSAWFMLVVPTFLTFVIVVLYLSVINAKGQPPMKCVKTKTSKCIPPFRPKKKGVHVSGFYIVTN